MLRVGSAFAPDVRASRNVFLAFPTRDCLGIRDTYTFAISIVKLHSKYFYTLLKFLKIIFLHSKFVSGEHNIRIIERSDQGYISVSIFAQKCYCQISERQNVISTVDIVKNRIPKSGK